MSPHVFGIRHHGPGSARALRIALEALAPDVLLVEGPADANETLSLIGHANMVPPVALLVHAVDNPQLSSFYPLAEFSPEWQALRYAAERSVPARFMDLPSSNALALRQSNDDADGSDDTDDKGEALLREDPIGILANAAGFSDQEQWWDVQVEQRRDASGLFEAITEAMAALREGREEHRVHEQRREAHMRSVLRAAQKEGFQRIALVCGAWHAPALTLPNSAKADAELLKGLPKLKVAATWIPWTHSRLSARSGYGAGVHSPGWYGHVWKHEDKAPVVWATLAARLLRDQDLDASSANVIETVRLAHALASVRELPAPGLGELRDAIEAVLCGGERARLSLIRTQLEIGVLLGEVPEQAGQVPLMRDFEQELKRLRVKLSSEQVLLQLDLRKDTDRDRSRLLHRLCALGVAWGRPAPVGKGTGTFKEAWQVAWLPELAVDLIAANIHGNTVEVAAGRVLAERAQVADLSELARLVEVALLAHLPAPLQALLQQLDARAATSSDVLAQMSALEPLARLARYGDVRETDSQLVLPVLTGLFERVVVGLSAACTQLDHDAAATLVVGVGRAHAACLLLDDAAIKADWLGALRTLLESSAVHPRLRGRSCRLLLEQRQLADGELDRCARLALSPAVDPAHAAQWLEGL
ncbi:MAG TPA: DUF5682 family protein, partial [Polyangiaceae bacterium]|nr:DUF5682 family protein [Polyangiaceae bacterium]